MKQVIIGVDPHKLSATIEVVDQHEKVLGSGRFATDKSGYMTMLSYVAQWARPIWAVEGSNGAGRSLAQRLVADGHHVVDVPAKLAARIRLLDTGHGRKPTRTTPTRSQLLRSVPRNCGRRAKIRSWSRCGWSSTVATS